MHMTSKIGYLKNMYEKHGERIIEASVYILFIAVCIYYLVINPVECTNPDGSMNSLCYPP